MRAAIKQFMLKLYCWFSPAANFRRSTGQFENKSDPLGSWAEIQRKIVSAFFIHMECSLSKMLKKLIFLTLFLISQKLKQFYRFFGYENNWQAGGFISS